MENSPEISRRPVRIIGTKEFAKRLDISVPHLRRLVREGKLPRLINIGARKKGIEEHVAEDVIVARRAAVEQAT